MRKRRRQSKHFIVAIFIMFLIVGFAAFSTTLRINGTYNIGNMSWDVHFENVEISPGSVTPTQAPTTNNVDTIEMTYSAELNDPGDYFEFTVDIVNNGTIDAMIDVVDNNAYSSDGTTVVETPDYLSSTVVYDDGISLERYQYLKHGKSEKIKVRVEFRQDIDISDLPSDGNKSVKFKLRAIYKQSDKNAKLVPHSADFETDSWDKIIDAYENNPSSLESSMNAGTTKEVQLDLDNDGTPETTAHLRIANLSTPAECSTTGFSQTACGLVIEFSDVITTRRMNPYESGDKNGDGNRGGWKYSDMRAFLNSGKYLEGETGEIDYTSTGIYNALPSELRSKIINTTVVSGYGSKDSTNFTTTDKLYLLSSHEVWEDVDGNTSSGIDYYDKSYSNTRQLDYYHDEGVTTSSYSGAIKQYNGSNYYWWLRSADSNRNDGFYRVDGGGNWYSTISSNTRGVSPAFRIG